MNCFVLSCLVLFRFVSFSCCALKNGDGGVIVVIENQWGGDKFGILGGENGGDVETDSNTQRVCPGLVTVG